MPTRSPADVRSTTAAGRRAASRAFTLIEVLVVLAIVTILTSGIILGIGSATNARLKAATTMIASAVRAGYARSEATAKPVRVVFDFDLRRVWLEEADSPMLAVKDDVTNTGGADPATAAEKAAADQADRILKGPRPAKAAFHPVKQAGLDEDAGKPSNQPGRELGRDIRFREVLTPHQASALRSGRAYLYIWPGGITESAYVQIAKGAYPLDTDTMTLIVYPLTGKTQILAGARTIAMPSSDEAAGSEREDRGPL